MGVLKGMGFAAFVAAMLSASGRAAGGERGVVLGYYPAWVGDEYPPEAVDFRPFTHVCHAFVNVGADGAAAGGGTVPSAALVARAHAAGVRVLLSLGGAESGKAFNRMGRDEKAAGRFVAQVMRMVDAAGYDGVDLDWEFPECKEDRENMGRMLALLRSELDRRSGPNRRLLLTAAVTAGDYYGQWHDDRALVRACDFINVMTYDYAGDWGEIAGHNAPLTASPRDPGGSSLAASMKYWDRDRGVPRRKLNVGIPCFGRGFDVAEPYAKLRKGVSSKYAGIDYRDLVGLVPQGWTRRWEKEAQVPWLHSPDGRTVIGYDDPESAALKGAWARKNRYGGIFFWDMNADRMPDGSHPIIAAAVKGWRGK